MTKKADSISESVRGQLLALGLPLGKHTPEALADSFPEELNIRASGLGADDLGRVFVYLAKRGVISLSGTAAGSVRKVEPGWHFCQFYRDYEQLLGLVAPYIADGLKNREGCLWVLPQPVTSGAACKAISRSLKGVDSYLASGQLELLSHPSWYLDPSGQLKSFEEISEALLVKQDRALDRGFKFLRAAGDAGWVSGTQESRKFIEYETKVNAAIGATKIAAVCTYRADVAADELVDIVTAHRDAQFDMPACSH